MEHDNNNGGNGECGRDNVNIRCPTSSDAFAGCDEVGSSSSIIDCFKMVLAKCNEERTAASELIGRLRAMKRYPHTGFFQQHFGQQNPVNCRTKDKLDSLHGVLSRLRADEIRDVYLSNLRFQLSFRRLVLTLQMLVRAVDVFIQNVTEYESYCVNSHDESVNEAVSSTTASGGGGSGSSSSNNGNEQMKRAFDKTHVYLNVIQALLNQIPMIAGPLYVELKLMHIYDNYDDTPIVHSLLIDQNLLGTMQRDSALLQRYNNVFPRIIHDWDVLLSEESSRSALLTETSARDNVDRMVNTVESQQQQQQQQMAAIATNPR